MSTNKERLRILLTGASLSGNMGGPALYISMVDLLRQQQEPIKISFLSKYPQDDAQPAKELGWRMVPYPTKTQLFLGIPFALLYGVLRFLQLPRNWLARGPFKEYIYNDGLIDLSGISFTDDRALSGLLINSLWLAPAVATGIPYIKASQAMGPFRKTLVRWAAKFFLQRSAAVIARGNISAQLTQALLPDKEVHALPDVAFALQPAPEVRVLEALRDEGLDTSQPYCVVGPSLVVHNLMSQSEGELAYPQLMASAVEHIVKITGHNVVLLAHTRVTQGQKRDDFSICLETYDQLKSTEAVLLLKGLYDAQTLKGIIGRAEIAVASRFHFMVATMSSGVPSIAVTWSHKYKEMMAMVGQADYALGHKDMGAEKLAAKIDALWHNRQTIHADIKHRLPEVKEAAAQNASIALKVINNSKRSVTLDQ